MGRSTSRNLGLLSLTTRPYGKALIQKTARMDKSVVQLEWLHIKSSHHIQTSVPNIQPIFRCVNETHLLTWYLITEFAGYFNNQLTITCIWAGCSAWWLGICCMLCHCSISAITSCSSCCCCACSIPSSNCTTISCTIIKQFILS